MLNRIVHFSLRFRGTIVALACVLGYRDLRFGDAWRGDHPRLVGWLDNFAARVPAFAATEAML